MPIRADGPARLNAAHAFEWFASAPGERESSRAGEITAWLESLWAGVRERVGPERFDPVLGEVRAGRFNSGDETAWAQTNGEKDSSFVNLTIEVDASELSLNLIGWFDPQLAKVESWLRSRNARRLLREHPDWMLVIFIRRGSVGASDRTVFRGAPGEEVERLRLSEASPSDITIRLSGMRPQMGADEKLALHLRRAWSRPDAEAPGLADRLAVEVGYWLDPLREIRLA